MQLSDNLKSVIRNGIEAFQNTLLTEGYTYRQVDIDCRLLPTPDFEKNPKPPTELWEPFFKHIDEIKARPALYYFEVLQGDMATILQAYQKFKLDPVNGHRATHALKRIPPTSGRILYVGKVKGNFGGRMVTHLGYYQVGRTAGLQLSHWAQDLGIKLRLHVLSFKPEMAGFVSTLELGFSRELNPMIGKQ